MRYRVRACAVSEDAFCYSKLEWVKVRWPVIDPPRNRGGRRESSQPRLAAITSQIFAATSGPPSRAMARMPVGDVTLISVR